MNFYEFKTDSAGVVLDVENPATGGYESHGLDRETSLRLLSELVEAIAYVEVAPVPRRPSPRVVAGAEPVTNQHPRPE